MSESNSHVLSTLGQVATPVKDFDISNKKYVDGLGAALNDHLKVLFGTEIKIKNDLPHSTDAFWSTDYVFPLEANAFYQFSAMLMFRTDTSDTTASRMSFAVPGFNEDMKWGFSDIAKQYDERANFNFTAVRDSGASEQTPGFMKMYGYVQTGSTATQLQLGYGIIHQSSNDDCVLMLGSSMIVKRVWNNF